MDRYVVLTRPGAAGSTEKAVPSLLGQSEGLGFEVADLTGRDVRDLRRDASTLGVVPAALPFALVEPRASTAPVATTPVWGLDATGARTSPRTGAGVRVAVLDTGCDVSHPAFAALLGGGRFVTRNFTLGGGTDVADTNGHGTHCAGTICGGTVDGQRIGVAPGIDRLIVGKVLGTGGGSNEQILAAIQWAASEGATIVSMSLGIDFPGWVDFLVQNQGLPVAPATSRALRDYRLTIDAFGRLADFLRTRGVLLV